MTFLEESFWTKSALGFPVDLLESMLATLHATGLAFDLRWALTAVSSRIRMLRLQARFQACASDRRLNVFVKAWKPAGGLWKTMEDRLLRTIHELRLQLIPSHSHEHAEEKGLVGRRSRGWLTGTDQVL